MLFVGWRGIFGFLGLFGLVSLVAAVLFLPESLPAERRVRAGLAEMAGVYGRLLKNRAFLRYAVALGCVAGVNFSYITGSPFVFIELHGVSPQQFGVFFGVNACGLIGASQLNRRLLRSFSAQRIMQWAFTVNASAALILTGTGVTGIGGFPAQAVLLFVCLCMTGLLYPNVIALAMAPFRQSAGSASALLGTIQYTIGASAGALVGILHNGTALPMIAAMTACGTVGWCAALAATRAGASRPEPTPP